MAADTYGAINFGITAETGFFIRLANFDFSSQEVWASDADGDDVAGAVFKHEGTFSLDGVYKTGESEVWTLGTSLTIASLANTLLVDMIPGYTTGALNIITSASQTLDNENLEGRSVSGVIKPFMGAKN